VFRFINWFGRKSQEGEESYTAFPFIRSDFKVAGVIPIMESFHDRLFPYSELVGNNKEIEEATAGNGITKIYIGTPWKMMHYKSGEPVGIYRKYEGQSGATYKSVITSFGTITKITSIKNNGRSLVSLEDYICRAGNKTVFTQEELTKIYTENSNVVMIEMVYNGFFGKGHNVNHKSLKDNGLFQAHPYNIDYTKDDFIKILEMGDTNVQNVIID